MFFNHIDAAMKIMAGLLRQGRFADEIMQMSISPNTRNATAPDESRAQRSLLMREREKVQTLSRGNCRERGASVIEVGGTSYCLACETIGPLVWRIREDKL